MLALPMSVCLSVCLSVYLSVSLSVLCACAEVDLGEVGVGGGVRWVKDLLDSLAQGPPFDPGKPS